MKDAESTWAIVVGIDTYENFRHLAGAANDAARAVRWLRSLQVPHQQIMLHAAPCAAAQATIGQLEPTRLGCTAPEILRSFRHLKSKRGSRLFVFLAGHGLSDAGGTRVFVTQEADQDVIDNIGIDWAGRFLRSLAFKRQFLIMDGCLNRLSGPKVRPRFTEGHISSAAEPTQRDDVLQLLCYAAGAGEYAREIDGHGVFSSALFAALDPEHPAPECVNIDDRTGAVQLDIVRAVQYVAEPAATEAEAASRLRQSPGVQTLSAGRTPPVVPIVELPALDPVRLRVILRPPGAVRDVARIKLDADENEWRRVLSAPLTPTPYEGRLPRGLKIRVRCVVEEGRWRQPLTEERYTDTDHDIEFDLEPWNAGTTRRASIQLIDDKGRIVPELPTGSARFKELTQDLDDDLSFLHQDSESLTFEIPDADAAQFRRTGFELAERIDRLTPPSLAAVFRSFGALEPATTITVALTPAKARRLVGLLMDEPVIQVDDSAVSMAELISQPAIPVDGGSTTVRLALPWGTWVTRIRAERGEATSLDLPATVGIPPLRTELLRHPAGQPAAPGTVVTVRADLSDRRIVDAAGNVTGALRVVPRGSRSAWRGRHHVPLDLAADSDRWRRYAAVGSLRFPLSETGAVAARLGNTPRAEPLSLTRSPEWDRLVVAGRIEEQSTDDAKRLATLKWSDVLLGLAGAYACYANRQDDLLVETLGNLRSLDPDLPDLPILEAALARRRDTWSSGSLAGLRDAAIPLYRWGVEIGLQVADDYEEAALGHQLELVRRRLVTSSVWTMWRA
jgi:hypothetical protein